LHKIKDLPLLGKQSLQMFAEKNETLKIINLNNVICPFPELSDILNYLGPQNIEENEPWEISGKRIKGRKNKEKSRS
jgi:hypothetical protein